MYEFECLTRNEKVEVSYDSGCSPFLGGCYPEAEDWALVQILGLGCYMSVGRPSP